MKLSAEQITAIKQSTEPVKAIAKKYGVSESAVNYHRKQRPRPAPSPTTTVATPPAGNGNVAIENGALVLRLPLSALLSQIL